MLQPFGSTIWVTVITPTRVSVVLLANPGGPGSGQGPRDFHPRGFEIGGRPRGLAAPSFSKGDAPPVGNVSPRPGPGDPQLSPAFRFVVVPPPPGGQHFSRGAKPGDRRTSGTESRPASLAAREAAHPRGGPEEPVNPHPAFSVTVHVPHVPAGAGTSDGLTRPVAAANTAATSDPLVPQAKAQAAPTAAVAFSEGTVAEPPAVAAPGLLRARGRPATRATPLAARGNPRGLGRHAPRGRRRDPLPGPLGSDLLADFQPGERGALVAAVDQFLEELQDLTDRLTLSDNAMEAALNSWPVATIAVLAGMELGRRVVKREGSEGNPASGANESRGAGGMSGRRGRLAGWPGSWSWTARARIT
ncbi:MAG: hypothetical protein U0835_01465 [Isosphaeraceae bacterium]